MNLGYRITVCGNAEARCPTAVMGMAKREHWPLEDPASREGSDAQVLAKFRAVRDQIGAQIQAWLVEQAVATESA